MMIVLYRRFLDAAGRQGTNIASPAVEKKDDETAMIPAEAENGDAVDS